MTHLVAGSLCRKLFISVAKIVLKHESRCISIPAKRGQISHTACVIEGRKCTTNYDSDTPAAVTPTGIPQIFEWRLFCRDIHIKRGKIFSDPCPDILDPFLLVGRKRVIPFKRVGRQREIIPIIALRIPQGPRYGLSVEIEVDDFGCRRAAVKLKRVCQREQRSVLRLSRQRARSGNFRLDSRAQAELRREQSPSLQLLDANPCPSQSTP